MVTTISKPAPRLRFKEFTDNWQVNKLRELCEMKAGKFMPANRIHSNRSAGTYICYGANGARGYVNDFSHEGSYSLIGRQGALCGNVTYVSGKFYATEHAIVVHPTPSTDSKWLYYQLRRMNLNKLATGQAQPGLSVDTIYAVKQINPSQQEQKKIAGFLTKVDERIELAEKKLELLKKYKKGMMQKLFTQKIRFKDSQLHPAWNKEQLRDIFDELTEKTGDKAVETYSITAGKGFVSQKSKFGKDISGAQNANYTLLRPRSFSYNKGNSKTYRFGCVYANNFDFDIAVPNVFISFKLKDINMDHRYFAQLFESHYLDRGLRKIISSGARMDGLLNVNKKAFFDIQIPTPAPNEQGKIADFLSTLGDKIKLEEEKLIQAKNFKKSLLQRLLV